MIQRILNRPFDCATPRFGQISIWLLIIGASVISFEPFQYAEGPRSSRWVTLFSWLPDAVLGSVIFLNIVRGLFVISALMWLFRKLTPWCCWVTVISFTLIVSLRIENSTSMSQMFNLTNILLVVHALWYHLCDADIRKASVDRRFGSARVYPRWVFGLSVFAIAWFHTLAGISKLRVSGTGWGDGLSLQLWTHFLGEKGSLGGDLLMLDTGYSAMFQTLVLVLECAALLSLLHWSLRYLSGIGLTLFYVAMCLAFPYAGFYFNAVCVALFLLPFDRWFGLKFDAGVNSAADAVAAEPVPQPSAE